ncbi:MAG: transcription termination/antitermination protein NusA [Alphaproteobacteria bacterium]|nr:MAG: transcription termination/antitermination protein NusA [Alphaproteobacteria bacterium]
MSITSANRLELLQIADAVAREKMIDREQVIEAMEESLARAAKSRYGAEFDIRAHLDRKTGAVTLTRVRTVVDEVEDHATEISLEDARRIKPDAQVGDEIAEELPPLEMGRVAAQSAKQVILQKVREAERERQYEEFKDRVGTIINGIVKREEYGNVIVDVGRGEAILRRDQKIPREIWRPGDRIRAYVKDVRRETRGPQIFLSRTAPEFMRELFRMEVPEVYEGIVEIRAVARDPGSRAKIAVVSHDSSIDPVGACVGMRGSRVQAVVSELQGEKIDIIPWSEDPATFLVSALQPADVSKVVIDEETGRIEVVVPDDQLSLAIGRRGQNVRLASQLTGLDIDIVSESEESERRQKEFAERTREFMDKLNVDEMVAQLLAAEGFSSVEEVAYVEPDELLAIEGFDEEMVEELQARAREYIEEENQKALARARELGVDESLINFDGLTPQMLVRLGEEGIKTLEDFATLADWELAGGTVTDAEGHRQEDEGILQDFDMTIDEARQLIMTARVALGWVDPEEVARAEAEAAEAEAQAAAEGAEAEGEGSLPTAESLFAEGQPAAERPAE